MGFFFEKFFGQKVSTGLALANMEQVLIYAHMNQPGNVMHPQLLHQIRAVLIHCFH